MVSRRRGAALAVGLLTVAFLAVGLVGLSRYLQNFWLYRGFPKAVDPAWVKEHGATRSYSVASAALGGRRQQVVVYLPPGYDRSTTTRYPVVYLLHGIPGRPTAFLLTVRMGVLVDILAAQGTHVPPILVMPNGYGAINIALHHPGEFSVVESWSGYQVADTIPSIFGRDPTRLAYNSPSLHLARVAPQVRAAGTYFWFYTGERDPLLAQNEMFARQLVAAGIPHRFFVVRGGHTWVAWRANAEEALRVAATRLSHG